MNEHHILDTYPKREILFTSAKGCYLTDQKGKKYLDFMSGIAVNCLGHCDSGFIKFLKQQLKKPLHVSNFFRIKEAEMLAEFLVEKVFDYRSGKAFFSNSGAEAVEAAIKIVRKYFDYKKEIITFKNCFHGRTMACISANKSYTEGFEPLLDGFKQAIFNDIESVKKLINCDTAGIMIEIIQGEGGVSVANLTFLLQLQEICREYDILLIIDEVQTGVGRTGKFFAFEHFGLKPDIICLAKGLGGGIPIGCTIMNDRIAKKIPIGSHGSTFGGNPFATGAALYVTNRISQEAFLKKVNKVSEFLFNKLNKISNKYPNIIKKIRGLGLMIGLELFENHLNQDIILKLRENGLLVVGSRMNTIRIIPPLIIKKSDVKKALKIFEKVLKEVNVKKQNN